MYTDGSGYPPVVVADSLAPYGPVNVVEKYDGDSPWTAFDSKSIDGSDGYEETPTERLVSYDTPFSPL